MSPRLSRRVVAPSLALLGAAGLGWGLWPARWTSQGPSEFPAALERYRGAVAAVAEVAPAASFVHTGHRAGSYQEFAKNLQLALPARPAAATALMDRAFQQLGLTCVEVDVRPSPLDPHALVLVHDRIDADQLDEAGRTYAAENTLRRLLSHFIAAGYPARGKRVALELKAPPEGLDEVARQTVDRTATALGEVLAGREDAARIRARIDLLSFSLPALERMRVALGPAAAQHGFYLIATSNQGIYPDWAFRVARLPRFDEALQAELRELPWLRGVFFDPRFVSGFARLFNGIDDARQTAGLAPLELHLSTYSHELPDLVERLEAEPEPLRHVRGLVYQVRQSD